jgi:hypothetical protein
MRNYYQDYKNLHDSIKPIRGRAVDVRPIGERHRDWEIIRMDGDVVACRLHDTDVVRYYPDGKIGLQCNGWQTPSTADFMHIHSPFSCFKRNNKLWAMARNEGQKAMHYPIPTKGEIVFEPSEFGSWRPVEDVVVEKLVVNRARAKESRTPYQPFLQWAKTFLKMSDGWIMHETRKQVIPMERNYFQYGKYPDAKVMELARSGDDQQFLTAMCALLTSGAIDKRVAEVLQGEPRFIDGINYAMPTTHFDLRYEYETLRTRLYKMVEKVSDIHDRVRVSVTERAHTNVV